MHLSIILSTYNEKGNISNLIKTIIRVLEGKEDVFKIIVVDDNSPDGTTKIVEEEFDTDQRVRLFVRNDERGLATAIRYGIEQSTGDVVLETDTDFNHDPQMIDLLKYYDMVIGSRFVLGGGMEDRFRYYCSAIYTIWFRFFLGIHIKDKLSGYFSIRKEALNNLDKNSISQGYSDYFMRLLLHAPRKGYRMIEVLTFYTLRKAGLSKTNFIEVFYNIQSQP